MAFKTKQIRRITGPVAWAGGFYAQTLAGNIILSGFDSRAQAIDPGGAHRDVTLHTVSADDDGDFYLLANSANAAENLVVKDAAGSTIGTVNQSEAGVFYVNAAGGWALFGILTYAAS
jgi:hypothetical protein